MSVTHLCDDLLFSSRVEATARAIGLDCKTVRRPEALTTELNSLAPRSLLVDLHLSGLDLSGLIGQLKSLSSPPFIVGYGSHVDTARLQAARDAGCDLVLPRSQFVKDLPTQLPQWTRSQS